jgi:DNA-directed RNA polymerase subunit delta
MKKRDIEINKLSYQDIAYNIIKEDKESKTTLELFKEICVLLELDQKKYLDVIGDFYTTLNLDKRFHLLEDGKWDLKEKYAVKIVIDEDDLDDVESVELLDDYDIDEDEEEIPEEDEEVEEEIVEEEEIMDEENEEINELEELTVVDEDDLESDDIL